MTTLRLLKKQQQPIGFQCEGHSGYAEEGEDIVCAAISSMTQFCIMCAEEFDLPIRYCKDEAWLECSVETPDPIFSGLLNTLEKSISQLQEDYPEYICLEIMEV
ncbi:MAG: ribosomal-processing cysteine protease Prp [Clostridia bacterium]|nr:ribosomal-processing cysteine protease Prp [Clostridia bacterium]